MDPLQWRPHQPPGFQDGTASYRRPHQLPALQEGTSSYLSPEAKVQLLNKYGNLSAPPHIRSVAALYESSAAARLAPPASHPGRSCERCEERCKQLDMRVAQLEHRTMILTNALRHQEEQNQRMSAALEELMAKTAALPLPRAAASGGLAGILGLTHDGGGGAVDAGSMVVPDPTMGGTGTGALFGSHGMLLPGGGGTGGGGGGADFAAASSRAGFEDEDEADEDEADETPDDELALLDEDGHAAAVGLEALAGMASVSAEESAMTGVGEAGFVNVPGRGMKQVSLQLQYREPVVFACVVPTRPGSASPSPQSPAPRGGAAALGFSSLGVEKARLAIGATQSVVCVPFKNSSSFTVQLVPPAGMDVTIAYLVLEAGAHTLDGGACLIAGDTFLFASGDLSVCH